MACSGNDQVVEELESALLVLLQHQWSTTKETLHLFGEVASEGIPYQEELFIGRNTRQTLADPLFNTFLVHTFFLLERNLHKLGTIRSLGVRNPLKTTLDGSFVLSSSSNSQSHGKTSLFSTA